jgi:hypothetical protein
VTPPLPPPHAHRTALAALLRAAAVLGAAAAGLGPAPAQGHPITARAENNRYVKLTVMGDSLRVAYSVLYGELPSFYARRAMDHDQDGRVSPEEARAAAAALATEVATKSVLTVDGRRVPLRFPGHDATVPDPRVGPIPFSIDCWELLPLAPGPRHQVSFQAGGELFRLGETEVKFEEAPGSRLLAWCTGHGPCAGRTTEPRFVWMGPPASSMEDRTVSATFAVVAAPGAGRGVLWLALGGAAALAAAGTAVVLVRRRRRRRR